MRFALICFAKLTLSLASFAAEKLTLQQAFDLAEHQHPQLRAMSAQIDGAAAGIATATAYPNPEAGFRAGGQDYRVPGNVRGPVTSFIFSQPLELGPLRPTRIEMARRGKESSEHAYAAARLAVLSAIRRTFFQALRRREEIAIHTENLRLVEEFRRRLQVRVDVGEAGRLELYRADAEIATARTALNSARLQYIAALTQLRAAIGSSLSPDIEVEGALDPAIRLPPIDELRSTVLERNPTMALAQSEVRRAESRLGYEEALRRPQPSVVVEVDRPPDTPTYRAGISIPLPVFNKRRGQIAEAAAQIRQLRATAESVQLQLLAALSGAYERYEVAGTELDAFRQGLLKEAEEGLRAAETAYRLGERGILEVLDAQRVLRTVRLGLINTQYDRQAALIDIDELRAAVPTGGKP